MPTNLAPLLIPGTQFKVKKGKVAREKNYLVVFSENINGEKITILLPAFTKEQLIANRKKTDVNFQFYEEQFLKWNSRYRTGWFKYEITPRYFDFQNMIIANELEIKNIIDVNDVYLTDKLWYKVNHKNIDKYVIDNLTNIGVNDIFREQIVDLITLNQSLDLRGTTITSVNGKLDLVIIAAEPVFATTVANKERTYFAISSSDIKKITSAVENEEFLDKIAIHKIKFFDNEINDQNNIVRCQDIDYCDDFQPDSPITTFFITNKVVDISNEKITAFVATFKWKTWPNNLWLRERDFKTFLANFNDNFATAVLNDSKVTEETLETIFKQQIFATLSAKLMEMGLSENNFLNNTEIKVSTIKFDDKVNKYHIQYEIVNYELGIKESKDVTRLSLKNIIKEYNNQYEEKLKAEPFILNLSSQQYLLPLPDSKKNSIKQALIAKVKSISKVIYNQYQALFGNEVPMLVAEVTLSSENKTKKYHTTDSINYSLSIAGKEIVSESVQLELSPLGQMQLIKNYYQNNVGAKLIAIENTNRENIDTYKEMIILDESLKQSLLNLTNNWEKNKYYLNFFERDNYINVLVELVAARQQVATLLKTIKHINDSITALLADNSLTSFNDLTNKYQVQNLQHLDIIINNIDFKAEKLALFFNEEIVNNSNIKAAQTKYQIINDKVTQVLTKTDIKTKFTIIRKLWATFKKIFYWSSSKYKQNIKKISDKFTLASKSSPILLKDNHNYENNSFQEKCQSLSNNKIIFAESSCLINNQATSDMKEPLVRQESADSGIDLATSCNSFADIETTVVKSKNLLNIIT